jgi:protein-tyrosine phosphatase
MEFSSPPIGVLFVCTGNICRSPTAEAVFRHKVREAGLESRFLIDSAGTQGYHIGDPPDERAIATALVRGVDMRDLRARKVEAADFTRFHTILAMDSGHYDLLSRFKDQPLDGLELFLGQGDVPDPYYGTQKGFDDVYDLIERGCIRLLKNLQVRMN